MPIRKDNLLLKKRMQLRVVYQHKTKKSQDYVYSNFITGQNAVQLFIIVIVVIVIFTIKCQNLFLLINFVLFCK